MKMHRHTALAASLFAILLSLTQPLWASQLIQSVDSALGAIGVNLQLSATGLGLQGPAGNAGVIHVSGTNTVSNTLGAYCQWAGASAANGGDLTCNSVDDFFVLTSGTARFAVDHGLGGELFALTGGLRFQASGKTIALEDDTAASTCMGTVTATGTTAVTVATTCIGTGDRIFTQRTSAVSALVTKPGCWTTNIVDGTSFDFDCIDANENSTFNWWVIKQL